MDKVFTRFTLGRLVRESVHVTRRVHEREKPSFSRAMTPKEAKEMYDLFVQKAREEYKENGIKEGQFGAMMDVHIENDGPVTVLIDSQNKGG